MPNIEPDNPLAVAVIQAIRGGDVERLKRLLSENPDLAAARIGAGGRSPLHIVADWPGHFPNGAAIVATLVGAGAEVNARVNGRHTETPLHWAASSDDLEVLDALLAAGADIESRGGCIGDGTPLDDAVIFGQWRAARRLVERGAQTELWHVAALGLMDRIAEHFGGDTPPPPEVISHAFWYACSGGQRGAAEYLLGQGADLNWMPGWEKRSPLDTARRAGAVSLVEWLVSRCAKSAEELAS
jgi:ankyrin repeat protein